jgi:integrase
MPKLASPLTELQVSKAKPKPKAHTLSDGNGLALVVSPSGVKSWTVRYRLPDGSRPAPVTIGRYPSLTLAQARAKAVEVQRDARLGLTASGVRDARRVAAEAAAALDAIEEKAKEARESATFRAVSARWLAAKRPSWAVETFRKARLVVNSHLVPKIGDLDMRVIETKDVRPVLIEMAHATPQLARKARQYMGSIVEQAIDEGLRSDESTLRLVRILPKLKAGHMPAVTDDDAQLGKVMTAIYGYENRVVRAALILTSLTAIRPGVAASARWSEIDLDAGEWKIPGLNADGSRRMKTGQDFTTSLPTQALEVLREMHSVRAVEEFVFPPQARQKTKHLHRDSLSKALREMGFQGHHTTHGFRASLRTLGRERLNIDVDVLESQLAHAPKDEVQAAYARVKFKEQRRTVMQAWADYLDELRAGGAKVVPFRRLAG